MKRERLLEILSDADKEVSEEYTDYDLIEYVTCLKEVQTQKIGEERWWDLNESIYEVKEGVYLKYFYASSTGDSTPSELGYEDGGLDDILEVQRKEIKTYVYV